MHSQLPLARAPGSAVRFVTFVRFRKVGEAAEFEPWLNRIPKPTSGSLTSNNSTEPPTFQSCLPELCGSSHHLARSPQAPSRSSGSGKWGRLRNFEPWSNQIPKQTAGSVTATNSAASPNFLSLTNVTNVAAILFVPDNIFVPNSSPTIRI
eukprot:3319869-Prymnesium_polylepis.1